MSIYKIPNGSLFQNQGMSQPAYKHINLPIYETNEFDFYRCIKFDQSFYGKTVSAIHQGNLRKCKLDNRYSSLFGNVKVSYWADSKKTALAEMDKHGQGRNLLTIWAYDDMTASFPTLTRKRDYLKIVDGRDTDFHLILKKHDQQIALNDSDLKTIDAIKAEKPDCMAYISEANTSGVNFLFFESGFKKLAIREISLSFKDDTGIHKNTIVCADTSDYTAYPKSYGEYFAPKAKVKMDNSYLKNEEYYFRKETHEFWLDLRRQQG